MSKQSKLCDSCGEENIGTAEFCTNCGTPFLSEGEVSSTEDLDKSYREWVMSVPYILAACLFLILIDLMTGSGINWSYWAVVPLFLFAIVAPYFSFKMGQRV